MLCRGKEKKKLSSCSKKRDHTRHHWTAFVLAPRVVGFGRSGAKKKTGSLDWPSLFCPPDLFKSLVRCEM